MWMRLNGKVEAAYMALEVTIEFDVLWTILGEISISCLNHVFGQVVFCNFVTHLPALMLDQNLAVLKLVATSSHPGAGSVQLQGRLWQPC